MLRPKLCLHRRILFLYLAIVLAGWTALTWRSHLKVYRLYFDSHEESQIKEVSLTTASPPEQVTFTKDDFVRTAAKTEVQHFDPTSIRELCANQTWQNDLVFECSSMRGGVGNVRQMLLSCVRWAIASGAGIIVPNVSPRIQTNASEVIVNNYSKGVKMDLYFDRDVFVTRLRQACPQMAIYENREAVPTPKMAQVIGELKPSDHKRIDDMRKLGTDWVKEHRSNTSSMSIVNFHRTMGHYEVCKDGISFAENFGQILTFRKDVHYLAGKVLYELSNQYGLAIDPSNNIAKNAFLGIHLRTSKDAVKQRWMTFEAQSVLYRRLAATRSLPVIYIASGNLTSISLFASSISPTPVVTKATLLRGKDLADLQAMTWDQQALVDYLVLLKSSQFLGMSDSSFSWNISIVRRAVGSKGMCFRFPFTRPYTEGEQKALKEGIAFEDDLSVVVGRKSPFDFDTHFWT